MPSPSPLTMTYRPGKGMSQLLCGTPQVLGMVALEAALSAFDGVDMAAVRAKSMALGDLFRGWSLRNVRT